MIFVAFILNEVINMSENSVESQIKKLQKQIAVSQSINVKDACEVFNALYKENKILVV